MSRKNVIVSNVSDSHANPIAELVQLACRFDSEIILESENRRINAKSIMGMMSLGLMEDDEVIVTANGPDEAEAVESMAKLLNR